MNFNLYDRDCSSSEAFITYCQNKMDDAMYRKAAFMTSDQSSSPEWFKLKQYRITASLIHQVSRCNTDGTLVQVSLGSTLVVYDKTLS